MTITDFFNTLKVNIDFLAIEYNLNKDDLLLFLDELSTLLVEKVDGQAMTIKEASDNYGIPQKALYAAQREGLIGNPILAADRSFLDRLASGWGKMWFLRLQVARLGRRERQHLVQSPEFTNAWERFVYGRYLTWTENQKRIRIDTLIDEVLERFPKLTVPRHLIYKGIKSIRSRVKEDKAYARAHGISLAHYAKKRGTQD